MRDRPPRPPAPRSATARTSIRDALLTTRDTGSSATARDLAMAAGISEKDVAEHLEHLARSLPHEALRLEVIAASCLACEYVFRERERLTAPSACPKCRSERVAPPSFRAVPGPRVAKRERPRGDDDE